MKRAVSAVDATSLYSVSTFGYRDATNIDSLQVLAVGPVVWCNVIRDALLDARNSRLLISTDHRELWVIPRSEGIHAAILHHSLSWFELEEACRFIRRRWNAARILLIREGIDFFDDALYDDRLPPAAAPDQLLPALEQLTGRRCGRRAV